MQTCEHALTVLLVSWRWSRVRAQCGAVALQVRIDMSEFLEAHSVYRLIGAPPGAARRCPDGTRGARKPRSVRAARTRAQRREFTARGPQATSGTTKAGSSQRQCGAGRTR